MAKKSKNSELLVHYTRTMTPESLSRAANYVGNYILKGLGAFGKIMTAPLTGGPMGTNTVPLYPKTVLLANTERKLRETQEELLGKAMTWVSPLNYGTALATGNGLDARKGEEEVASWSPAWLAVGRIGELYVGPKAVKGVKSAPRAVVNTAAKAGVKPAKTAVVAREIKLGIKLNTKNGRIEVTDNYFHAPDKWYRTTETPEKYGIMEQGKNVTTHDAPLTLGTINGWRSSILNAKVTKGTEGFIKKPPRIELNIRRKNGQAHGNTSQAAKGELWEGTTSGSRLFPEGIIEGQAPSMINYGIDRTNFVITPWELVPNGGRVGFHTGEMPMSNLGWFQRTNRGTYTYEPIIPEKRINVTENLDWTRNLPRERDYSMSRQVPYSGYTPIRLSPLYNKFVRDVMQGYRWGKNRGYIKPIGYRDLTGTLGKQIDHGAESYVFNDVNNPNQVLKVSHSNSASTPQRAIELGTREMKARNSLPYNLPLNVEGYYHLGNTYFPVYSLRKVYVPQMDQLKVYDFDSSVDGMYWAKPDINNILLENGIDRARDFKLPNIGFLPDGTVMGIDLWKNGGKMNILEFLKNGSGIHIKKKNRGKFTSYCGGKVTDECIQKGKNSSNPAIRKRATFAANARKWKHKSGGLLKFEDGGKNAAPSTKFLSKLWFKNTGNNIGSFLTSDTGKGLLDIGLNILSGYTDYKRSSNLLDSLVEQSKASLELSYLDIMLEAMKNRILKLYLLKKLWQQAYLNGETLDNYSDIVASNMGWKEYSLSLLNAEQLKKQLEALIDLLAKQAKGNALGGLFGSVVLSGLGVLGNVLGNKNSTTTQNLLNNSTIGKSTNPYMYTGLGANYNASTFFK